MNKNEKELLTAIQFAFAKYESNNRSLRIRKGLEAKRLREKSHAKK